MKKLIILTALAFLTSVSYATAEGGGGERPHKNASKRLDKMFEQHDLDKDGVVTKEEFLSAAEERFEKMDADGNEELTKDEAKAHHTNMKEKWKELREKAKNNRGKVSEN